MSSSHPLIRGLVAAGFLVLFGGLSTAAPALLAAEPAADARADSDADAEDAPASWSDRLKEASDRIARARLRASKAEGAYSRARHDGYPRGDALGQIKKEWDAAAEELRAAREALPELVEEARQAGAEASVLRPYDG